MHHQAGFVDSFGLDLAGLLQVHRSLLGDQLVVRQKTLSDQDKWDHLNEDIQSYYFLGNHVGSKLI